MLKKKLLLVTVPLLLEIHQSTSQMNKQVQVHGTKSFKCINSKFIFMPFQIAWYPTHLFGHGDEKLIVNTAFLKQGCSFSFFLLKKGKEYFLFYKHENFLFLDLLKVVKVSLEKKGKKYLWLDHSEVHL